MIAALEHHRVRYVVIGGVAAQLHGSSTRTRGLDLTPDRSASNFARLAAALASVEAREWVPGFGYPLQMPMDRRRLAGDRVLLTQTRHGRVDVVPVPHGLPAGYDELEPRARRVPAYGADVSVACLSDLVRSHAAAGRGKDKLALSRLIDLRLRTHDESLPPHILQAPEPPAAPSLHDALAASERLAVVFDVIRPQLAYVRRELYRAVDSAMYGEATAIRDSIDRARHAASHVQVDVQRLRHGASTAEDRPPAGAISPGGESDVRLTHQADQELRVTLQLLASAAARLEAPDRNALRDLLIEARVHTVAADNDLDLLQIRLEHLARRWEDREPPTRGESLGRE
ncbi:MAG: hypothetical protein M3P83_00675 [Actinomycetota bacterium]|nr:hypothetical protein [Actinomycetota bacterium]